MNVQSLTGDQWRFRQAGADEWLPATVPGGVHTDLLALGGIPDPFVADNEKKVMWVAEQDWDYRRTFTVEPALLDEDKVFLVCDGLDTLATSRSTARLLGETDNMFRRYEWEVKGSLLKSRRERAAHRLPLAGAVLRRRRRQAPAARGDAGHPRRPAPAQGALPVWLGLGSHAAADRRLAGHPPRRAQPRPPGRRAPAPAPRRRQRGDLRRRERRTLAGGCTTGGAVDPHRAGRRRAAGD